MTISTHARSLLALVALSSAIAPAVASACGGAITSESVIRMRQQPLLVAKHRARPVEEVSAELMAAQTKLEEGDFRGARALVMTAVPDLKEYDPRYARPAVARALRTFALATVRPTRSSGAESTFALATLRGLLARDPEDAVARTDLGEALARIPMHEDEAREILESLASDDLMVHPRGFAALARQRLSAGAVEGARAALDRCEAMATTSHDCEVQMPHPPST